MEAVGDVVLLLAGVLLLWLGARWLVAAAARLAAAAGVSSLVVGLTVVAFGTSAPELAVSIGAGLDGRADVAVGNVVGSNVFNLALVLGLVAVLQPFRVSSTLLRRDAVAMGLATGLGVLALWNRVVTRVEGAILVALLVAYFGWLWIAATRSNPEASGPFRTAGAETADDSGTAPAPIADLPDPPGSVPGPGDDERTGETAPESADRRSSRRRAIDAGQLLLGLVLVVSGGQFLVDGATAIALTAGVSEWVVGVTLVAAGTSLPELVTSIVATRHEHVAMAAGNVIGSNVFNLLGVLGIAALVRPLSVAPAALPGLAWLALVTAIATLVLATGRRLTRLEGVGLVVLGLGYWAWSAIG